MCRGRGDEGVCGAFGVSEEGVSGVFGVVERTGVEGLL
jgi:hypothetical protein